MGKRDMNRQFTEKEMQIALIYMKIFTTFHKRNVLITAKLRYCFSPIRLTKIPKFD